MVAQACAKGVAKTFAIAGKVADDTLEYIALTISFRTMQRKWEDNSRDVASTFAKTTSLRDARA